MPLVDVATDARLHYEDSAPESRRTPFILAHGMLGTARLHLGGVMDWLSGRGERVIGLTLRGYGESLPKPRDFPDNFYRRDARDLLAFMDALDLPSAHLLGYSDGGEVVMLATGLAPQRIASCIAIGAIGNFGPELRPVFQRVYPGDWITDAEKRLHGFDDAAAFTRDWSRAMTRMIDAGGDVSLSLARHITCPLKIVLGVNDKLNPPKYGERFISEVSRGELVMIKAGHAVQDHAPDAFFALLARHCGEVAGESS